VRCARVGGWSLMRGVLMGGTLRGLGDDQAAAVGAGKRTRRPGHERHSAELQAGQRQRDGHEGFCAHQNVGGAEAPEQLLPYLERRLAVSDHTGSVY